MQTRGNHFFFPMRAWNDITLNGAVALLIAASAFFGFAMAFRNPLLAVFPKENAGLSDDDTSWFYGIAGVVGTVTSLLVSYPLDRIPTLAVSIVLGLMAAALHAILPFLPRFSMFAAMFDNAAAIPIAEAIVGLSMTLALKRLVDVIFEGDPEAGERRYERIVYVLYALNNLLMLLGSGLYDLLLQHLDRPAQVTSVCAWIAAGVLLVMVVLLVQVRRVVRGADQPSIYRKEQPIALTLRSGTFWRFAGVGVALSGVRLMFRHLDLTLIQWMVAVEGPRSHYALVQGINPFIIVCLTPFMPVLLRRLPGLEGQHYRVLALGTGVSAMGPLVWGLALAGGLNVYAAAALGIAIFSVGEAIWSPRFLQYCFEVAPRGSEAVFAALASLPLLFMRLPAAYLSNVLMDRFCPSGGTLCQSANLWSAIGITAATTPLILVLFQRVLEEERRPRTKK